MVFVLIHQSSLICRLSTSSEDPHKVNKTRALHFLAINIIQLFTYYQSSRKVPVEIKMVTILEQGRDRVRNVIDRKAAKRISHNANEDPRIGNPIDNGKHTIAKKK